MQGGFTGNNPVCSEAEYDAMRAIQRISAAADGMAGAIILRKERVDPSRKNGMNPDATYQRGSAMTWGRADKALLAAEGLFACAWRVRKSTTVQRSDDQSF